MTNSADILLCRFEIHVKLVRMQNVGDYNANSELLNCGNVANFFNGLAKSSIRCYCFRVPGARNARATVRRLSTATWTLVTCSGLSGQSAGEKLF